LHRKLDTTNNPRQTEGVHTYESKVKHYREQAGLTQEGLARELNVSRQTVVNIERGTNEPKVLLAIALGAILGVAVGELFWREVKGQ
jgi:putative transcriptional regulator